MCGSCSQVRPTSNCDTAEASNRPCTPSADLLPAVVCILLNSLTRRQISCVMCSISLHTVHTEVNIRTHR